MQFFSVLKADGKLARDKDPYLDGNPDSDSDSDDYHEIRPEDKVFCAVSCEEESCTLEMYVYDEDEATMYVHHDIMLDAYPLCVDWLPKTSAEETGSFAAIGLIDHQIQIWDLDRLDPLAPTLSLGEQKKAKTKLKKKKSKAKGGVTAHEGPVLAIHGSVFNRSVLASGSGDETVKIWDVAENSCVHTYTHHSNKVQCVKWHPTEQAVLLSASFDRRLALLDVRQPGQACTVELPAENESAIWSRHNAFECFASVDNGGVVCYDVRKVASKASDAEKVVWHLMAHDVACTAVQDTPVPNLLVTSSLDGHAKIWNTAGSKPSMVMAKNLQAGPLFACQSNPEAPALVSFGGNVPVVWDLASEELLTGIFDFGEKPNDS
jgi:periodic tryptophan protein 1